MKQMLFLFFRGGGGCNTHIGFDTIISLDNLFAAWNEFKKGKSKKKDVLEFELNLENNIFDLHKALISKRYEHSPYTAFSIADPKLRRIHKAMVRDRIVHHALFRIVYPIFDKTFIFDSYSCRLTKGVHKAVNRLEQFACRVGNNYFQNIWVLKCDIRKFFDSIDHEILLTLLERKIQDYDTLWLIRKIILSFEKEIGKGLPLGNITSQLFANIYLNEFDQFVKHRLKIKEYIRYCDDFIILAETTPSLVKLIISIQDFLKGRLKLNLHPKKITIRKFSQGIDFLGYISLLDYRLIRSKTRRRIFRKLKSKIIQYKRELVNQHSLEASLQSYLGVLSHAHTYKLSKEVKNQFWHWMSE